MIPASGPLPASQINTELALAASSARSLNEAGTRLLTTNTALLPANTRLAMSALRGHSGYGFNAVMRDQGGGIIGAIQGDGVNPSPLGTISGGSVPIREISTGRTGIGIGSSIHYTRVRMNVPQPFNRFWALAAWSGGTFLGYWPQSGVTFTEDAYSTSGYIGVGWPVDAASGPNYFDLRPYLGATLHFVFFLV